MTQLIKRPVKWLVSFQKGRSMVRGYPQVGLEEENVYLWHKVLQSSNSGDTES